jgi:hypothetical protein
MTELWGSNWSGNSGRTNDQDITKPAGNSNVSISENTREDIPTDVQRRRWILEPLLEHTGGATTDIVIQSAYDPTMKVTLQVSVSYTPIDTGDVNITSFSDDACTASATNFTSTIKTIYVIVNSNVPNQSITLNRSPATGYVTMTDVSTTHSKFKMVKTKSINWNWACGATGRPSLL